MNPISDILTKRIVEIDLLLESINSSIASSQETITKKEEEKVPLEEEKEKISEFLLTLND